MSEKKRTPQANIAPFGLRMQPELKARVEASAQENNRSINAEIVSRLEESFGSPFPKLSSEGLYAIVKRFEAAVEGYDAILRRHIKEIRHLESRLSSVESPLNADLIQALRGLADEIESRNPSPGGD